MKISFSPETLFFIKTKYFNTIVGFAIFCSFHFSPSSSLLLPLLLSALLRNSNRDSRLGEYLSRRAIPPADLARDNIFAVVVAVASVVAAGEGRFSRLCAYIRVCTHTPRIYTVLRLRTQLYIKSRERERDGERLYVYARSHTSLSAKKHRQRVRERETRFESKMRPIGTRRMQESLYSCRNEWIANISVCVWELRASVSAWCVRASFLHFAELIVPRSVLAR